MCYLLVGAGREKLKQDGVNIADWLTALALFTGHAAKVRLFILWAYSLYKLGDGPRRHFSAHDQRSHGSLTHLPLAVFTSRASSCWSISLLWRSHLTRPPPVDVHRQRHGCLYCQQAWAGVDVAALAQYLTHTLRSGQAFDLLLLKELVSVMTVRRRAFGNCSG